MATHSSILAWRIPWTEELQSLGLQRVGHESCQCREHEFDPWSGKISHTVEQLSPCTTTTKLVLQLLKPASLKPVLCSKRSHRSEKSMHCSEEQPPFLVTGESLLKATKTQNNQKEINK